MKTPLFNLHDLILLFTLGAALTLALFQWLLSKQKPLASHLLGVFFLCIGLGALARLLLWNGQIHLANTWLAQLLPYVISLEQLGKGICLLAYVRALTSEQAHLGRSFWLQWLILAVFALVIALDGITSEQLKFLAPPASVVDIKHIAWLWHGLKLVPFAYGWLALWVVLAYQRQLKEYYSDLSLPGPRWLLWLTLGFALSWSWTLGVHVYGQFAPSGSADFWGIADNYLTFLLVNAFFVYSLAQAHQLLVTQQTRETQAPTSPSESNVARIKAGMEQQQLYLKPNLNIEEFSRQIGVHFREVSSIINSQFNTNFFEFVNQYRVERAKALLRDPAHSKLTIMEILLEAGFNSKSAFNRFFKRYTSMSAAEFRKLHQQQQGQ